ncbi:cytochrome c family protein [uncultured Nisaea sp.]|jgi:cytochrome c|uniref:c-type cytochrome n=1 Tax=uncultured Nisaea sp. TaxID=538215 RepID=UPI0030ED8B49|tara:strand:+ start:1357 stop:1740 length:384 start_codon:yes stop_codon:yes gene_type:complete
MLRKAAYVATLLALTVSPAMAGGDAAKGEKVFRKCKACHVVDAEKNRVGPHLVGVIGRPAAHVEKFKYSKAMEAKAAEGLVWDEVSIAEFLAAPKKYIKGTKMAFVGLKKQDDIDDVIAYIKAESGK